MPALVNMVLFALLIWLGFKEFERLINVVLDFLPAWLDWLGWLLWPLFVLLVMAFVLFGFSLVANLIGAPFNGLLAEAVEQHLIGRRSVDQGWRGLITGLIPALLGEVRKLVYFIVWAIPFLILFLIPGVNLIAPFLWIAFSAWALALQYMDYPLGNHGLTFRAQRELLRHQRLRLLGFGGATLLVMLIPVVNFLVMPAAVAGATLMWVELLRRETGNQG